MAIYGNAIMTGTGQGSGGEILPTDAILRVVAPAGSTVTITKGTTTKSDMGHENSDDTTLYDYYFVIHQSQFDAVNAWTVEATLNGQRATTTIVIDAPDEYNIVLSYGVYLYNFGDVATTLTGGYISNNNGNGTNTFYINTADMTLYSKSTGESCNICCYPANTIDLTGFRTLKMLCDLDSTRVVTDSASIGVRTTAPTNGGYSGTYLAISDLGVIGNNQVVTVDVSAINQAVYIVVKQWIRLNNNTQTLTIKQIWLER